MNSKMFAAFAAVALLTACASKPTIVNTAGTGAVAPGGGPVPGSEEDLVQNVGDRVFFDFDRSNLRSDAQATLDRQIELEPCWSFRTVTLKCSLGRLVLEASVSRLLQLPPSSSSIGIGLRLSTPKRRTVYIESGSSTRFKS